MGSLDFRIAFVFKMMLLMAGVLFCLGATVAKSRLHDLSMGHLREGGHLVCGCCSNFHSLLLFTALGSSLCMLPDTLTLHK